MMVLLPGKDSRDTNLPQIWGMTGLHLGDGLGRASRTRRELRRNISSLRAAYLATHVTYFVPTSIENAQQRLSILWKRNPYLQQKALFEEPELSELSRSGSLGGRRWALIHIIAPLDADVALLRGCFESLFVYNGPGSRSQFPDKGAWFTSWPQGASTSA
jgi:hypothetical protein